MKKQLLALLLVLALGMCAFVGCTPADVTDEQPPVDTPKDDEGDPSTEPSDQPAEEIDTVKASNISFTVGNLAENQYIYEDKESHIDKNGNRYCDLERYVIYRFPVHSEHEVTTLRMTIGNQYRVEASADGVNYDVMLSTTDKTPINMVLDLVEYLPVSGEGYVYIRISDADPSDGWGANIRCTDPVLFFSGDEETAQVVIADYQKKLQLTQSTMSAMFDSYVDTLSNGSKLPYRLYVPEDYDPKKEYPLLVVLHGAGERGNDNESQLKHMLLTMFNLEDSPVRDAIIFCPQCPAGQQWVDTPWANGNYSVDKIKESVELEGVMQILDWLTYEYSVDENRIYAMGLSMGGFGTWDLLMRHNDVFAAGVPICGGADPAMAEALVDVPIWTFHGSIDPTVPVAGTREMAQALEDAGSVVFTYEEFEGQEHGIWNTVAGRADVIKWLFEQNLADR